MNQPCHRTVQIIENSPRFGMTTSLCRTARGETTVEIYRRYNSPFPPFATLNLTEAELASLMTSVSNFSRTHDAIEAIPSALFPPVAAEQTHAKSDPKSEMVYTKSGSKVAFGNTRTVIPHVYFYDQSGSLRISVPVEELLEIAGKAKSFARDARDGEQGDSAIRTGRTENAPAGPPDNDQQS